MHRRATSGGLLSYIKDVDPALAKEIGDTVPGLREHLAEAFRCKAAALAKLQ